ncbi:MAG: DUF885 domain-containing protein [Micromonosporaceae bacterium]
MLHPFVPLAERVIDALLDTDPVLARWVGDHRGDGALPDYSPDAVAARVAMLRDASHALVQLDTDGLTPQEEVDHTLLTRLVDRYLFEYDTLRSYTWSPLVHNPGPLLYALLARRFAPAAERLAAVASRLEQLPDALATARAVLTDCPTIHLETARSQYAGVRALVADEVTKLAAEAGGTVAGAQQAALDALDDFDGWLGVRLEQTEAGTGRDPRLGRPLWEAQLWHLLDSELSAGDVLDRAWAALEQITEQLREAAAEYLGGARPGSTAGQTVRMALDRIADEHPTDATIVGLARDALAETTGFVTAHDLVTLVDDPCEILVMPEFARGVAVAYCDAPGPLEQAAVPTFYAISPTPAGWSPERVTSYYREYNNQLIRNLTVHEAMPGHFVQLAHARRYAGSSRTRAVCKSGSFVEGWAVYAEDLMVGHGFGGLPVRLQQLKMRLRMTINALLDQLAHCEGMSEVDGMRLMTERGFQEEGEAAGKWRRALLTAGQLSTYFVGYLEVSAVAAARPAGTGLRQWHDAMLGHGSPSPRHLRSLLSRG